MGIALSQPVELTRVQRRGSGSFRSAVAEMQGWRSGHEDAHDMLCTDKWGSFWVLDGHGGEGASLFCAPRLGEISKENLADGALPADDRMSTAFEGVDKEFLNHTHSNDDRSGSTVVGSLITKAQDGTYSVKICNAGDSRGLVVAPPGEEEAKPAKLDVRRPSHVEEGPPSWPLVTASVDHKPNDKVEKERIEKAGGFVSNGEGAEVARLDGSLAVSRGLGDFEYKQSFGRPACEQKVSCIPDIYEVHGLKEGSICILACDGLWDVMGNDEVGKYVRDTLKEHPKADLGVMCADLIHKALKMNSRDNITVMIIQMVDGSDWSARSGRFNESDEIMHFDKMAQLDKESRGHYNDILRRWKFPEKPVQCAISGRWYSSMFKCPGTGQTYSSRHYQKKGWTQFKKTGKVEGAVSKARAPTEDENEAW